MRSWTYVCINIYIQKRSCEDLTNIILSLLLSLLYTDSHELSLEYE
jgi:hypothetical protein